MDSTTKWIMERKNEIYRKNIKTNNSSEFAGYEEELKEYGDLVISAIDREDFKILRSLGWPSELDQCIKEMYLRTEIKDIIENCIRFQYNRSPKHFEELTKSNSGLDGVSPV